MAKGFTLEINPWIYIAQYGEEGVWTEKYQEQPHLGPEEEAQLDQENRKELLTKRNLFDLPLVNLTTQYGFGCFEGLKAFPQKDGSLKLFRPKENAKRMNRSMAGLRMPPFPEEMFLKAVLEVTAKNRKLGFTPTYDEAWAKDSFVTGHSFYIRPFTYSEPGIGVDLSYHPWVVIVTTMVGAYFQPGNSKAVTTDKIRAQPGGTGWIKCDANYVMPSLVKKAAVEEGYMEAIFLDAEHRTYVEEGSSCNIFFLLKSGVLVTPDLRDTILPGITRESVIQLASDQGISVEERQISIDEVFSEGKEVFVTGTAVGVTHIESITHNGNTVIFQDGKMGEIAHTLLVTLKGIQYGAIEDRYGWMYDCEKIPTARSSGNK